MKNVVIKNVVLGVFDVFGDSVDTDKYVYLDTNKEGIEPFECGTNYKVTGADGIDILYNQVISLGMDVKDWKELSNKFIELTTSVGGQYWLVNTETGTELVFVAY